MAGRVSPLSKVSRTGHELTVLSQVPGPMLSLFKKPCTPASWVWMFLQQTRRRRHPGNRESKQSPPPKKKKPRDTERRLTHPFWNWYSLTVTVREHHQ